MRRRSLEKNEGRAIDRSRSHQAICAANSMPFGQKKEPAKKAGVLRFFSLDLHQVSTSVQTVTHVYRWVRLVTAWLRRITEADKR